MPRSEGIDYRSGGAVPTCSGIADGDAVAAFERARRQLTRSKRVQTLIFGTLFLAAVVGSLRVGEVSLGKFAEGFPGLVAYIAGTLPTIRLDSFTADVAEWYWGLGRWLSLLLDTTLIAFMGTLLGTTGAFIWCFPASRNLTPHRSLYVISRRLLEIARTVPDLVYALIFIYAFTPSAWGRCPGCWPSLCTAWALWASCSLK